jgi:curli production assembly/transport component CsgG
MPPIKIIKNIFLLICILQIQGCKPYLTQTSKARKARMGEESPVLSELKSLPKPKEQIAAAVYKFRDQTGQYKLSESGASWSTAISQGTTPILLKALEESKWFLNIERENISNLMNERKIIRQSMAQYQNSNDGIPPLLFAGILLEGGIVSYDANIVTGGTGLRYFGSGGSTQYRQDRITVYLRAIATKSGKIVKTVYTSKTILSQSIDAGVFRYVKLSKLLEAETGVTTNEPAQMALTEAIEKAVAALVIEGIKDKLWEYAENDKACAEEAIAKYDAEKTEDQFTDVYGVKESFPKKGFSISPNYGVVKLNSDYRSSAIKNVFGIDMNYRFFKNYELSLQGAQGEFGIGTNSLKWYSYGLSNSFFFQPSQRLGGFIGAGIENVHIGSSNHLNLNGSLGMEFHFNKKVAFRATAGYYLFQNDLVDEKRFGTLNDNYWKSKIGFTYYFKDIEKNKSLKVGFINFFKNLERNKSSNDEK